jgi:hypothetical protein
VLSKCEKGETAEMKKEWGVRETRIKRTRERRGERMGKRE